jgi:hypothetical protein
MSDSSTLSMSRPGPCEDIYYYSGETSKKQCWATTQNTKYQQAFANLSGGTSVLTLSPNNGVQDVIIVFKTQAFPSGTAANVGLPRGWGYSLINRVSFRYGGSSQFFISGDQLLQNALRRQPSRSTANDVLTLGGNGAVGAFLETAQYAMVVLTLPHSTPSGVGKAFPFPSDALTQQIQITCELNPVSSIFTNTSGALNAAGNQLDTAYFQVQQVMLRNQGDALARRVDMSTNAYAYPCEFVQQKVVVPLTANTAQSISLSGFRSGEVKSIELWLVSQAATSGVAKNPLCWVLPDSCQLTYQGDIYSRFENRSSAIWNLINGNKAPVVDNLQTSTATPPVQIAQLTQWVSLPFAQTLMPEETNKVLVHGLAIQNGIVQLDITPPQDGVAYYLNVSYVYNSTLLLSQGTAEYLF